MARGKGGEFDLGRTERFGEEGRGFAGGKGGRMLRGGF